MTAWVIAQAVAAGTSHVKAGLPCQDSCFAAVEASDTGPALVALVADGAGSARFGGKAADFAMQAAAQWLAKELPCRPLTQQLAVDCVREVRRFLLERVDEAQVVARDFACTLLGAVVTQDHALILQLGDGGVVLFGPAGYNMPVWPDNGEYANETRFVTDEDALLRLQVAEIAYGPTRVALLSDGVQRIALNFATRTAHGPFFDTLFEVLNRDPTPAPEILDSALARYLDSDAVNRRSDDDKTLVLALRKDSISPASQ